MLASHKIAVSTASKEKYLLKFMITSLSQTK